MTIQVHPEALVQLQQSHSDDYLIEQKKPLTGRARRCLHSTDDDQTVDTISTTNSDYSDCLRVSFSEELVTDVWTRPATEDDELSDLFYTKEETDRFRVEYRMERKLVNSFDDSSQNYCGLLERPRASHDISRVVILHQDNHTMDVVTRDDNFDTPEFWSGSLTWW